LFHFFTLAQQDDVIDQPAAGETILFPESSGRGGEAASISAPAPARRVRIAIGYPSPTEPPVRHH